MVFLHTETQTTDGMDKKVEVINEKTCPMFFNEVGIGIWPLMNAVRKKFNEE